jgi:hypothetical protein
MSPSDFELAPLAGLLTSSCRHFDNKNDEDGVLFLRGHREGVLVPYLSRLIFKTPINCVVEKFMTYTNPVLMPPHICPQNYAAFSTTSRQVTPSTYAGNVIYRNLGLPPSFQNFSTYVPDNSWDQLNPIPTIEEKKECTCGAKHTSFPNSHSHWCDAYEDQS